MNEDPGLLEIVERALREDLGGELDLEADLTTRWTVGPEVEARARILSRGHGVLAGVQAALLVFRRLDPDLDARAAVADGADLAPGDTVLHLSGAAAPILAGERTALNLLQQLSGIASLTRSYVDAVAGTRARITDTRKTSPGLRRLQKEAVRSGGGFNHRFGLHDAVLIKENHARAAGGVVEAVRRARRGAAARGRGGIPVMCEAETPQEVAALLDGGARDRPDRILLDNMAAGPMAESVRLVRSASTRVETEATGGVTLRGVRAVAETGVDWISVGALTHSAPALDLSLLFEGSGAPGVGAAGRRGRVEAAGLAPGPPAPGGTRIGRGRRPRNTTFLALYRCLLYYLTIAIFAGVTASLRCHLV